MDDAVLVTSSVVIAIGTVQHQRAVTLPDGAIVTESVLRVEERLKGRTRGTKLVVTEPGGEVGETELRVFGTPEFHPGERTLVFLRRTAGGRLRVNGLALGKFAVETDTVVSPVLGAAPRPRAAFLARIAALAGDQTTETVTNGHVPPPTGSGSTQARFTFLGRPPHRWFENRVGLLIANADVALGADASSRLAIDAMAAWSEVPGVGLALFDAGGAGTSRSIAGGICDGRSVIQFNDPQSEIGDLVGCSGVVAVGGFCRRAGSTTVGGVTFARIEEADVTVNNRAGACFGAVGVAEVVTHELGHAIGLGHSSDRANETDPRLREATMFLLAHLDGRGASLRDDDRDGVRAIYPAVVAPDTDGDGVADASDRCPETPAGSGVDATGCACDEPGHAPCDDGNPCTVDECSPVAATCTHRLLECPDDDGDPCTVPRCDPTRGCESSSADTDGDTVCDALDPCPRIADAPATDSDGDGIGDACECAEPAPGVCIPGRGRPDTRCLVEWRPLDPAVRPARSGAPILTCRDGDPACDRDQIPGQCTFRVLLCLNLRDPRFPSCHAVRTTQVRTIARAGRRSPDAFDRANARAVRSGLALDRSQPDQCSAPLELMVPRSGQGPGRRTISVQTRSVTGQGRARLRLRCLP